MVKDLIAFILGLGGRETSPGRFREAATMLEFSADVVVELIPTFPATAVCVLTGAMVICATLHIQAAR